MRCQVGYVLTLIWSSVCCVSGAGGCEPGGASDRDSDSAPSEPRPAAAAAAAPFTSTEPTEPTPEPNPWFYNANDTHSNLFSISINIESISCMIFITIFRNSVTFVYIAI